MNKRTVFFYYVSLFGVSYNDSSFVFDFLVERYLELRAQKKWMLSVKLEVND